MYTIAWAAFFKWFGPALISWLADGGEVTASVPAPIYGTFGIIVGLIILFSSFYPISWIYLIVGGTVGKIILASWFGLGFLPEIDWNKRSAFHLIFNELLWIIPLSVIFLRAWKVKKYLKTLD